MSSHESIPPIVDTQRYLGRMSQSLEDKLMLCHYLPSHTKRILDVGCADGAVTIELAKRFPHAHITGIDLDQEFIDLATQRAHAEGVSNVTFEQIYLRDLLARPERFDAITFISVLHEFYSYGQGISSVFKALADAHELLEDGGVVAIRDMVVPRYFKSTCSITPLVQKIHARVDLAPAYRDVASMYGNHGALDDLAAVNHFFLKYRYTNNWEHEMKENYLAVTLDDYMDFVRLLGLELLHARPYLLPFLRDTWQQDFGLTDQELNSLYSTSLIVAQRTPA